MSHDKPFCCSYRWNLYNFSCESSYKWCHLIQMAWKRREKNCVERIAPFFMVNIARAVTASEVWTYLLETKGTCSRRQLLFYVFLSISFFINCHFHPQEHELDERKSFVLISEESEDEVSSRFGVSKSFICFVDKSVSCPLLMIIWFLFLSEATVGW